MIASLVAVHSAQLRLLLSQVIWHAATGQLVDLCCYTSADLGGMGLMLSEPLMTIDGCLLLQYHMYLILYSIKAYVYNILSCVCLFVCCPLYLKTHPRPTHDPWRSSRQPSINQGAQSESSNSATESRSKASTLAKGWRHPLMIILNSIK